MSALPLQAVALALLGSLVSAALALGLGTAAQRLWRLPAATPGFWLCAWCLAVLPPLLSLLLAWLAPAPMAALPAALPLPLALDLSLHAEAEVASTGLGWPSLGGVLMTAWCVGGGIALLRLLAGSVAAWRIVRQAVPVRRSDWPGVESARQANVLQARGIDVRLTTEAMTPFAVRWPQRTIVLPEAVLPHLNDAQLRLVLRHEAAHLLRRDPQRAGTMAVIGALLWFNPFVRMLAARVQMATELRCDALALAGDTAAGRSFAAAYLTALRLSGHGSAPTPLSALTHRDMAGHRLRIQHMLLGGRTLRASWARRMLLVAGMVTLGTALTAVQAAVLVPDPLPRLASAPAMSTALTPASALPLAAQTQRFDAPLDTIRVSGHYGDNGGIRQRAHRGTDFAARVGTPVRAPADGVVLAATAQYPEGPQYGTVVVLDHGNGWQSLFAHLDSTPVQPGQRVRRGELIARSGRSGRVTGPHLHMELLFNGERVDPLSRLQ